MAEMKAFVFCVTFIVIFAGLVVATPQDFLGPGSSPDIATPIDPILLTGFEDTEQYYTPDFVANAYWYPSALGSYDFVCTYLSLNSAFYLSAKSYFFGLWLGSLDAILFINYTGGMKDELPFTDIDLNANDGVSSFGLRFETSGQDAGSLIVYYNTTDYADASSAWAGSELYFLHGIGLGETATNDVGSLLVSLLFLQLPDIPPLVNLLLVTPIWASVIYVLWYIIKEMIPFV